MQTNINNLKHSGLGDHVSIAGPRPVEIIEVPFFKSSNSVVQYIILPLHKHMHRGSFLRAVRHLVESNSSSPLSRPGRWDMGTPHYPVYIYIYIARARRSRGKPVLIMHIGFLACFHAISPERSGFSKIATLFILPL